MADDRIKSGAEQLEQHLQNMLKGWLNGDQKALACPATCEFLHRLARTFLCRGTFKHLSDDAVQEFWYRFMAKVAQKYDRNRPLTPFVCQTQRNILRDHLRMYRSRVAEEARRRETRSADTEMIAQRAEWCEEMWERASALPPQHFEVLGLYRRGLSIKHIANVLDISYDAAALRLSRARKALAATYRAEGRVGRVSHSRDIAA